MDLYLERNGKGERLLFIHGAGASSAAFYFQKQYLKRCCEVILFDLPARGRSGGEGRRSIADYIEIVHSVMTDNGLDTCHVVGSSSAVWTIVLRRPRIQRTSTKPSGGRG